MSYTPQSYVTVLELWDETDYEQFRQNMASMPTALFTQKGQVAAGTGAMALGVITSGSDGQAIVVDTAEATGMRFEGGAVPLGCIIVWSGSQASIPTGWQLCDGTNGTPDLRGKFVIGAGGDYAVGSSGSGYSLAHTHSLPEVTLSSASDAHQHTQPTTSVGSGHSHTVGTYSYYDTTESSAQYATGGGHTYSAPSHDHTLSGGAPTSTEGSHSHTNPDTNSAGGSHTHTVGAQTTSSALTTTLPPYYALCYIQRVL